MGSALGLNFNVIDGLEGRKLMEFDLLDELNWRILAQIDTPEGQLLVRIPLYDSAVRELVENCSK